MHIYTHTHDTDCPILLLRDIQLINTECTPCKYRTDVELMQDLRNGYVRLIKSGHRIKTLGVFNRP